jgi:heme-degrading monooxygenase HmoA
MFMRFLRLKVKEEKLRDLQRFYRERVVPALHTTPGCIFASLLQPGTPGGDCISLTLWRGPEYAEAYESGGLFQTLLDECTPFLTLATEWKVKLTESAGPEVQIRAKPPEVEAFHVSSGQGKPALGTTRPTRLHLRIVSLLVQEDQTGTLAARYQEEIVPELLQAKGCIGSFLVEGVDKPNHALSVTLWERDEDAVRYELTGAFRALMRRLSDILADLTQWRMSLVSGGGEAGPAHATLDVDKYSIVVGERFDQAAV